MWDATVVDTIAPCHYLNSALPAGVPADAETAKRRQSIYNDILNTNVFQPVAVETTGVYGKSTYHLANDLLTWVLTSENDDVCTSARGYAASVLACVWVWSDNMSAQLIVPTMLTNVADCRLPPFRCACCKANMVFRMLVFCKFCYSTLNLTDCLSAAHDEVTLIWPKMKCVRNEKKRESRIARNCCRQNSFDTHIRPIQQCTKAFCRRLDSC